MRHGGAIFDSTRALTPLNTALAALIAVTGTAFCDGVRIVQEEDHPTLVNEISVVPT